MTEWDAVLRIGLALVAGAMLGFEREIHDKPAGIRTYALVCQGAALFMVLGILLAKQEGGDFTSIDPTRIASTVVQGIGFLAGGVIFTLGARVRGLTTAAGIWVAAAVGLAIGGGVLYPRLCSSGHDPDRAPTASLHRQSRANQDHGTGSP